MTRGSKADFNSTVNGTLQALFALLVLVMVANADVIWVRALHAGSLSATEEDKKVVRE